MDDQSINRGRTGRPFASGAKPLPKRVDGRRSNKPPVEHQIEVGEVRNPWGRKGKPKPTPTPTPTISSIDDYLLHESARVVSRGPEGPVTAAQRLVQEEFVDALRNGNSKVRERLLTTLHATLTRKQVLDDLVLQAAYAYRQGVSAEFNRARACRRSAPDFVPHPEHVRIEGFKVWFSGPTDEQGRRAWERIKAAIKIAAFFHDRYRRALRSEPTDYVRKQLAVWGKHRRWLMRQVPKGWNWRETIWCRDSDQKVVDKVIATFGKMSICDELAGDEG
jgi:hypothetical protein